MKLRNKKTGDIVDGGFVLTYYDGIAGNPQHSLAELNEEWEDYEEPKEYWYLSGIGEIRRIEDDGVKFDRYHKEIGNYFSSREEAEKAVEKLKAWKRLKDKGFRFTAWKNGILLDETVAGQVRYEFPIGNKDDIEKDLAFLFGGEE